MKRNPKPIRVPKRDPNQNDLAIISEVILGEHYHGHTSKGQCIPPDDLADLFADDPEPQAELWAAEDEDEGRGQFTPFARMRMDEEDLADITNSRGLPWVLRKLAAMPGGIPGWEDEDDIPKTLNRLADTLDRIEAVIKGM
jgi:hypothetical protein